MKEKISITESVIKNSIWSFLLSIVTKGGGLLFVIILARLLLPESFGIFSLALSISAVFMSLGNLGLNQSVMVFFSKFIKQEKKAVSYFNYLFKIKVFLLFLLSLSLFVLSNPLSVYFKLQELNLLLKTASFYIFFFSLSAFFSSFFYIHKKVKLDFFKESLFQIIRLILVFFVFLYAPQKLRLFLIFLVLGVSSAVMLVFNVFNAKKLSPCLFSASKTKIDKKRVLKFLFFLAVSGILIVIFADIDILMLGKISGDMESLGYYKASLSLVFGAVGICTISQIFLPIFSSFKKSRAKRAMMKVLRYVFMLNIPATFGVLILGRYFLVAFYSYAYIQASLIVSFLSLLIFSETTSSLFSQILSSREKSKSIMFSLIASTIANVFLNYVLISYFLKFSYLLASVGAALATVSSRMLFTAGLFISVKKEMNFTLNKSIILKPLLASLIMSLVLLAAISNLDIGFFSGIFLVVFGALIYFSVMCILKGIGKEDFKLIQLIFKRGN